MCSHKKGLKHIDWTIHSVGCVMHKWCDLGMPGVKNLGVDICDDAQSTACSNVNNNNNNNKNNNDYNNYYYYYYSLPKFTLE